MKNPKYEDEYEDQFPPATINSDPIIDFFDGKSLTEKDKAAISFFPNIYIGSAIRKNRKYYLTFQDNMGFHYDIKMLKRIISHLQKTVKNITNDDLIDLQKERRKNAERIQKEQSPPLRIKNKTKGRIYILKAVGQTHYKIGKTTNLNARINQIKPALPFKTRLIHTISSNNITKAELFLHEKFKDKRTNGEWFNLSKDDVQSLQRTNVINR